jgi:hypothetical protein
MSNQNKLVLKAIEIATGLKLKSNQVVMRKGTTGREIIDLHWPINNNLKSKS